MSSQRGALLSILDDSPDDFYFKLFYWSNLLNFYQKHKDILDDDEILMIYHRSELIRKTSNEERYHDVPVVKDGVATTLNLKKRGLECKKEEVSTDLYIVAEELQSKTKEEPKRTNVPSQPSVESIAAVAL